MTQAFGISCLYVSFWGHRHMLINCSENPLGSLFIQKQRAGYGIEWAFRQRATCLMLPSLGLVSMNIMGLARSACNKRDILSVVPCWQDALDFGDSRAVN